MRTLTTIRNVPTVLLLLLLVLLIAPAVTSACPLCKGSVADDEFADGPRTGPTRTARAYGWSIAFMLTMPFLVIGGFAFIAVNAYRRNLAGQQIIDSGSDAIGYDNDQPPSG